MRCFVYECKDKKAISKVRYFFHYHKIPFKTFKKGIVVFADVQPVTKWNDVPVIEATQGIDIVGNEFFIKKKLDKANNNC